MLIHSNVLLRLVRTARGLKGARVDPSVRFCGFNGFWSVFAADSRSSSSIAFSFTVTKCVELLECASPLDSRNEALLEGDLCVVGSASSSIAYPRRLVGNAAASDTFRRDIEIKFRSLRFYRASNKSMNFAKTCTSCRISPSLVARVGHDGRKCPHLCVVQLAWMPFIPTICETRSHDR